MVSYSKCESKAFISINGNCDIGLVLSGVSILITSLCSLYLYMYGIVLYTSTWLYRNTGFCSFNIINSIFIIVHLFIFVLIYFKYEIL